MGDAIRALAGGGGHFTHVYQLARRQLLLRRKDEV
jgi:hypothetical protein